MELDLLPRFQSVRALTGSLTKRIVYRTAKQVVRCVMVSQKTTFLIIALTAVVVVLLFVFVNLVSVGASSNDNSKHKNGKHKNKPAEVVQAANLQTPAAKPPLPYEEANSFKVQALSASQSSTHRNAYPLKNDYRLVPTGAVVSAQSIAVTTSGVVFCIDTTNELLFSSDSGKTFQPVYLAPRDVAVDKLADLAFDSILDTISILRNEGDGKSSEVLRQRIDTFSVDSLLQSSAQYPVKTRWQSHAQQPDGSNEVAALVQQHVQQDAQHLGALAGRYSSIAYDNDGVLYALYQSEMQQTDVYSIDQKSGASAFKGPIDSGVLKLMFDPRRSETRYLTNSYCVTNTLYRTDNALALVNNTTGLVRPLTAAPDSALTPRVTNGMYQSLAGNALLLYTVKANRLYYVTQSSL